METEEELIFGKFKIGDVVVSLTNRPNLRCEGDLFVVLPNSDKYALYYLPETNNGQSKEWRLATKEEKEAYEKGIKNIKDMAPTIFKKGQYIVTLIDDGFCGKINYCSKQKNDSYQLEPEIDTIRNKNNKNGVFRAKDVSFTKWRWATKEEEEEYERRKKPFDVTELNPYNVGDWVIVMSHKQCGRGNGILKDDLVTQLEKLKNISSGVAFKDADFVVKNENGKLCQISKSHIIRKATEEEVSQNNSKFIVGKWYQFDCYNHTYVGKFSEETSDITSVDWIVSGQKQTSRGTWPKSGISNIKMLDVSVPEIQDFLPKNHPDKINSEFKCIPGEIYRVDWVYKNSKYFLIFKSDSSDYKTGKVQACNAERFFNQIGVCSSDKIKFNIKEATLEEKQWLDRCIQENKWVPMKQEGLIKGEIYKCEGPKGSIFMYDRETSASHYIGDSLTSYVKGGGNFHDDPEDYKLANEEDKKWLLACIKADRFITKEEALKKEEKEYKYHVVECKTQEEWDFVRQNVPGCTLSSKLFKEYEKIGIAFKKKEGKIGTYCNIEWFEKNNSKIYSFDEWKKEMNITDYSGVINYVSKGSITTINVEKIPSITTYMVDYSKFDKCAIYTKPGMDHQEPIIKKKINKQKSILVL